jgi:hypothetical protein
VSQERQHNLKVTEKGKIYFCRRVCNQQSPVSKHTGQDVCTGFIYNASLPLTLTELVLSLQSLQLASLKKGHMGQWTLGQGEQKFT